MATAPDAIWQLWRDVQAKWGGPGTQDEELSGIVGDRSHSFGFHLSPNDLYALGKADDYSLLSPRNRAGAKAHPDMASAIDIHFGPNGMILATKRLIASARDVNDPRLDGVYEFCGTTNGRTPHPYTVDTQTDDPNNTQSWDDSHVWHVHLSFYRDVCTDYAAIKGVADVLAGLPMPATPHPSPHPNGPPVTPTPPSDFPTSGPLADRWTNPDTGVKRTGAGWIIQIVNLLRQIAQDTAAIRKHLGA